MIKIIAWCTLLQYKSRAIPTHDWPSIIHLCFAHEIRKQTRNIRRNISNSRSKQDSQVDMKQMWKHLKFKISKQCFCFERSPYFMQGCTVLIVNASTRFQVVYFEFKTKTPVRFLHQTKPFSSTSFSSEFVFIAIEIDIRDISTHFNDRSSCICLISKPRWSKHSSLLS